MSQQLKAATHEVALRKRFGIPEAAQRVLVLGESSHWDPNWLLTSREYYRVRVEKIIDQALDALSEDSRRVYSVESIFFLRMYDERRADRRALLRLMLNEGRLRLTGSSVSSPDTLVTPLEGLIRDYASGADWLRSVGVSQTARVAYFPDNFGHSPCLPSLLRALSIPYAGITRIDGMYFPGTDYRGEETYPWRGSSAERLLKDERSLTFRWQAPDASEVLCHWHAFGYGQGDLLGHVGVTRWMGLPLARVSRATEHIVKQIDEFVAQLAPLSRTPYLFCPIGFDFVSPISNLLGLIDTYNERAYPRTGTFVINAALDDYLDLTACRMQDLPALALDPNPYWTGFYAARPQLKRSHHRLVERASQLEAQSALHAPLPSLQSSLREVWNTVAFSNHHDFVTGTSPDRVYRKEQRPLLSQAHATLDAVEGARREHIESAPAASSGLTTWREGNLLWVDNGLLAVAFDEARGGAIREVRDLQTGEVLLDAGSLDLTVYRDGGGLWRMGHEVRGGRFGKLVSASERPAQISCEHSGEFIVVTIRSLLDGQDFVRTCRIGPRSRFLWMSTRGDARDNRTVCARLALPYQSAVASMGCPGGVIKRPYHRHYDPTFWPAQSFVHLTDGDTRRGVALFPRGTASVSFDGQGALSLVAQRTARLERAFSILPVLGFPASGREHGPHEEAFAITFTKQGDFRDNLLPSLAQAASHGHESIARRHIHPQLIVDDERVSAVAFKHADNGKGHIIRLLAADLPTGPVTVRVQGFQIIRSLRCDALEHDLEPLTPQDGALSLRLGRSIETLRVELRPEV